MLIVEYLEKSAPYVWSDILLLCGTLKIKDPKQTNNLRNMTVWVWERSHRKTQAHEIRKKVKTKTPS